MVGQVLDPAREIQDDHKKARDAYFDFLKAIDEHNLRQAKDIFKILDLVMGPHWKWEEESLYQAVKATLSEELYNSLMKEHDECIDIMKKLGAILDGKKHPSPDDWSQAKKLAPAILYHIATCDGLPIMMERLGEEELWNLRQAIFAARRESIPLREWAEKLRKR